MRCLIAHAGCSNKEKDESFDISNYVKQGKKEKTAVDAVEKVINGLEDDKRFNAGIGSKLQMDGMPRPEAGIMKGGLEFGSVSGLEGIKNPVSVARKIMEESNNNFITAPYSTQFALMKGFEKYDLYTEEKVNEWMESRDELENRKYSEREEKLGELDGGTVGCVALDKDGNMCAATSTGGRRYQVEGRVGDSPIIGCGFYCDGEIAVSATGHGESIMKSQLCRRVSENYNGNLESSVKESLNYLNSNTEGFAGLIAISSKGERVVNHNGEYMIYSIGRK